MDKNDKYYNLIESMVKQHKKYLGLEPLLEDIIDDVYKHSSIVFNTISNEDVLTSYLQKIISTSLITVPKRKNFNTHKSYNTIDFLNQINKNIQIHSQQKQALEEDAAPTDNESSIEPKVNKELVDKMINSINDDVLVDNNTKVSHENILSEHELENEYIDDTDSTLEIDDSIYDDLTSELSRTDESIENEYTSAYEDEGETLSVEVDLDDSQELLTEEDVLELVKKKVPNYMVPQVIIKLASVPYNANGKIDRKKLGADFKEGKYKNE